MSYAARHDQLLDIAERLFVERTYALTSMEDIARAADVTRPIVYNHFDTKEGTFIACVRRVYDSYNEGLRSVVDPESAPTDQLRAGAQFYFGSIEQNEGRWLLLFTSASVLTGIYRDELVALRSEHVQTIAALLRIALPDTPDDFTDAAAHALSGIGERLGHWWLTRPDLDREMIVEHFCSIAMGGLGQWVDD
ncbi:TetR/AcrR family transcriptional regulator [Gordonia sp. HY002]|uniref:TetR/AcrR family transcriptional regulator n=1 Tax=Gordonia zhenghanii TaxID=2911516 RepID=UPI001EF0A3D8|nr:TetR/AcrR family transcriptional regulator [Gordonia zhenghanii]MCF8572030.1 TetR/AcrR family transcriptional regulator [Gordonia zhenghanii]MCF8604306.1 TetR/AcrR family transcriptional regulator [Gordonia zhenghanii]